MVKSSISSDKIFYDTHDWIKLQACVVSVWCVCSMCVVCVYYVCVVCACVCMQICVLISHGIHVDESRDAYIYVCVCVCV